jgi:2-polyprenyl-6-methoxyphenol hydroxylase-like FAD-dependent oxidoreductase
MRQAHGVHIDDRDHAVVIGASMGGLSAAAALAPHYRRVTVLDRDALPREPAHRRGVPQSKHSHGFQPGGLVALDDLLPGMADELVAEGAPRGDVGSNTTFTVGGSRFINNYVGISTIGITRPFLEHRVRRRVAALPNVVFRDRTEVCELVAVDPRRVTGVRLGTADTRTPEVLEADLVVDASGKVSRLPAWLARLGYKPPTEERVTCRMVYLSRRWRLDPAAAHDAIVSVVTPADQPHFGVIIEQEDGTHIVTLGGLFDSGPRRDDDAYLAFARSLPDQVIADALVGATPVTDYQPAHFPASVRRRYDRLRAFPVGLLALGDSIAAFNPMYGQGMSVAALEALRLRDMLARGALDARAFFKAAHRIEDVAWKISTGGDLRYPEVDGRRTRGQQFMNAYLDRLAIAAHDDPVLAAQFMRVAGFIDRPEAFFKPGIVRRVLRRRLAVNDGVALPRAMATAR